MRCTALHYTALHGKAGRTLLGCASCWWVESFQRDPPLGRLLATYYGSSVTTTRAAHPKLSPLTPYRIRPHAARGQRDGRAVAVAVDLTTLRLLGH